MIQMKRAMMIFFIALVILGCKEETQAQNDSTTPEVVKKTFQTKYPGEDDPDWEKDDHGNWESHFKMDGISYRADFSPDGAWIETETSIDKDDLPQAIKDIIKAKYPDDEITEVEKVMHHSKGTFYDVEFKQKGKNHDVEFDPSGKVIGETNRKD